MCFSAPASFIAGTPLSAMGSAAFRKEFGNSLTPRSSLLVVYLPPLARVLDTVPPTNADLAVIMLSVISPIVIVELTELFAPRKSGDS